MAKYTPDNLASLSNETTALSVINTNFARVTPAIENTLSRDGTLPNAMGSVLDMNSHKIINLPAPSSAAEPVRVQDLNTFAGGGTIIVEPLPPGGTAGQALTKLSDQSYDVTWSSGVDPNRITTLETEVNNLMDAQASAAVGFASKSIMDAAFASYPLNTVAYCYDTDPTLAGIYVRGAGSWGTRVATLPSTTYSDFMMAVRDLPPKPLSKVLLIRTSPIFWIIRTPLVGGKQNEFTEWVIRDYGPAAYGGVGETHLYALFSVSTNEGGTRRIQSDGWIHGAVWEYAMNCGLMTDPLNTWVYYGNGHDHVTYTGASIIMDAGGNLRDIPVGTYVYGSSLTIAQDFNIRLPNNDPSRSGAVIGTISSGHTFSPTGCLVSVSHTITAPNIGNMNSYSAMMPFTGCNRIQFGANTPLTTLTYDGSQSAPQGLQSTIKAWHTDRPDLTLQLVLPNGTPGSPDGWTNDTTSNTFVINNTDGYSKAYVNYRSGNSPLAATNSSHVTNYSMVKA